MIFRKTKKEILSFLSFTVLLALATPARAASSLPKRQKVLYLGDSQSHALSDPKIPINFMEFLYRELKSDANLDIYMYAMGGSGPHTWLRPYRANFGYIQITPERGREEVPWPKMNIAAPIAKYKPKNGPEQSGILDKIDFDLIIVQTGDNSFPNGNIRVGDLAHGVPKISKWIPAETKARVKEFEKFFDILSNYNNQRKGPDGSVIPRRIFWIAPPQQPDKIKRGLSSNPPDPDFEVKMQDLMTTTLSSPYSYVFRSLDYPELKYDNFPDNDAWRKIPDEGGGTHHSRTEDLKWAHITAPLIQEFLYAEKVPADFPKPLREPVPPDVGN